MAEAKRDNPWSQRDKLTELRRRRGLTVYRLAKLTGLTKQYIARLESGERGEPSWNTVQRLSLALEVDVNEFRDPELVLPDRPRRRGPGKQSTEPESTASAADH